MKLIQNCCIIFCFIYSGITCGFTPALSQVPPNILYFATDSAGQTIISQTTIVSECFSTNAGNTYEFLSNRIGFPNFFSRNVTYLSLNGDTILLTGVSTDRWMKGGVYTHNRGQTWVPILESHNFSHIRMLGQNRSSLAVHPTQSNIWYLVNGAPFLGIVIARSTNAGNFWLVHSVDSTGGSYPKIYLDPTYENQIWTVSNYWNINNINQGGIHRSTDGGLTWTGVHLWNQLGINEALFTAFARVSDSILIASIHYSEPISSALLPILISTDNGITWSRTGIGLPYRFDVKKLLSIPQIPGRVLACGSGKYGLYRSDDYGRNWTREDNGLPSDVVYVSDISYNQYSNKIYASMFGYGVYVSNDYGNTWSPQINLPDVGGMSYNVTVTPQHLYLIDDNFRIWRYTPETNHLLHLMLPDAADTLDIEKDVSFVSGDTLWVSMLRRPIHCQTNEDSLQMLLSTNNGVTWSYSPRLPDDYHNPNSYRRTNGTIVTAYLQYYNYESGNLITNLNFSPQWNRHSLPPSFNPLPSLLINDTCIFLLDEEGCFYTTNYGQNWVNMQFPNANSQSYISSMGKIRGDTLYFLCDTLLWKYHPNTSWYHSNTLPDSCVSIEYTNTNPPIWIASSGRARCFVSQDFGFTWRQLDYDLNVTYPFIRNWIPVFDSVRQVLWLPTSVGLFYANLNELSIQSDKLNFYPIKTASLDCYPNPTNHSIQFKINTFVNIPKGKLTVYNTLGQEVYSKQLDELNAGIHLIPLDTKSISSGNYYVKLFSESLPLPIQTQFTVMK